MSLWAPLEFIVGTTIKQLRQNVCRSKWKQPQNGHRRLPSVTQWRSLCHVFSYCKGIFKNVYRQSDLQCPIKRSAGQKPHLRPTRFLKTLGQFHGKVLEGPHMPTGITLKIPLLNLYWLQSSCLIKAPSWTVPLCRNSDSFIIMPSSWQNYKMPGSSPDFLQWVFLHVKIHNREGAYVDSCWSDPFSGRRTLKPLISTLVWTVA